MIYNDRSLVSMVLKRSFFLLLGHGAHYHLSCDVCCGVRVDQIFSGSQLRDLGSNIVDIGADFLELFVEVFVKTDECSTPEYHDEIGLK